MKKLLVLISLLMLSIIGFSKTTSKGMMKNGNKSTMSKEWNMNMGKKILIVYHSATGSTEKVAKMLQEKLGADIISIEPVIPYDVSNPEAVQDLIQKQQMTREQIAITEKPETKHVADYDVILFGTPSWFSNVSPPIISYLDKHDLSGKTVAVFSTYGGVYGDILAKFESSAKNLKAKEVKKGLILSSDAVKAGVDKELNAWIKSLGLK